MSLRPRLVSAFAGLLLLALAPFAGAQPVSLAGGTPAVQTFDTLAASGTASTLPPGWSFLERDNNANGTYVADNGATGSGNTYSYGATAATDRAFGTLRSGSLNSMIGAQLRNDSGVAISEIAVTYTGEQWRLGMLGRSDRLDFQYSLDAETIGDATATWVDVNALDFVAPVSTGVIGALNGNLAANRTAINAMLTEFTLAANATMWVRWVDVEASGADDGLAIDDTSFGVSGEPPVDIAPTVTSTSPTNNAINVSLTATLGVGFSEPVELDEPWFTLDCADSGMHAATVSGGPTSYTLAPVPAFTANELCTWTILAAGVTDLDGKPNALASNVTRSFTTLDPANIPPPTVISLQPSNGATNVPAAADLRVIFSEAVTTTSTAFALTCNSAPVAVVETGTGTQRTLTPATVLPANANCTFAIDAASVRNSANITMAASVTTNFTIASGDVGAYYSRVNTSEPAQLRCSLHATIRGHTAYPYSGSGTNTWTILETAQALPGTPARIIDVYRNRAYNAPSDRAGTGGGLTYNREHTWPNSLGFPSMTGNLGMPNAPYTDTHMLYLSDTQWNSDRGNKPYANCAVAASCGERVTETNGGVGGGAGVYPGNSNWVNANSFETWNHRKGDSARAVLYMAIRYEGGVDPTSGQNEPNLELTDDRSLIVGTSNYSVPAYMGLLTDLLAWHQADPPDAEELARNAVIYSFQGNRNPFIDHPEWATRALFESVQPSTCVLVDLIFADGFDAPGT